MSEQRPRLFETVDEVRIKRFVEAVGRRTAEAHRLTPTDLAQRVYNLLYPKGHDTVFTDQQILDKVKSFLGRHVPPVRPKRPDRPANRVKDIEPELNTLRLKGVQTYLDIGCGEGNITAAVASVLGLISAEACDIEPTTVAASVHFQQNTTTTLPYPDETFDLLTMFMSAHHFIDVEAMFGEAHRVARPGATLIMREHARPAHTAYYNQVHALYACTTLASDTVEVSPAAFLQDYERPQSYAQYRTPYEWTQIAKAHGFIATQPPHGPINRHGYEDDVLFDAVYLVFEKQKVVPV